MRLWCQSSEVVKVFLFLVKCSKEQINSNQMYINGWKDQNEILEKWFYVKAKILHPPMNNLCEMQVNILLQAKVCKVNPAYQVFVNVIAKKLCFFTDKCRHDHVLNPERRDPFNIWIHILNGSVLCQLMIKLLKLHHLVAQSLKMDETLE